MILVMYSDFPRQAWHMQMQQITRSIQGIQSMPVRLIGREFFNLDMPQLQPTEIQSDLSEARYGDEASQANAFYQANGDHIKSLQLVVVVKHDPAESQRIPRWH